MTGLITSTITPDMQIAGWKPQRLREILAERRAANIVPWAREDVATAVGIRFTSFASWVSGKSSPGSPTQFRRLLKVLGLDYEDLVEVPADGPDLRHLRQRAFLTASDVSERLGVSQPAFSQLELYGIGVGWTRWRCAVLAELYGVTTAETDEAYRRTRRYAARQES